MSAPSIFGVNLNSLTELARNPARSQRLRRSNDELNGVEIGDRTARYPSPVVPRTRGIRAESIYRAVSLYLDGVNIDTSDDPGVYAASLFIRASQFENQAQALTVKVQNDFVPDFIPDDDAVDLDAVAGSSQFVVGFLTTVEEDVLSQVTYPSIDVTQFDLTVPESDDELIDTFNQIVYAVEHGIHNPQRIRSRRLFGILERLGGTPLGFPPVPRERVPGFSTREYDARRRDLIRDFLKFKTDETPDIDFSTFVTTLFSSNFGVRLTDTPSVFASIRVVTPAEIDSAIADGLFERTDLVFIEVTRE